MVTPIRVSICGTKGSGATSLAQSLDRHEYTRLSDNRSFKLYAHERGMDDAVFPESDFVLFTFSLESLNTEYIGRSWRHLTELVSRRYADQRSKICFVGTKNDLVPPNSAEYLCLRCFPSAIAFEARVKFVAFSAATLIGLDETVDLIVNDLYPLPLPVPKLVPKDILIRITNNVLNLVASIFSLCVSVNINQETPDPIEIADDDVVEEMSKAPDRLAYNREYAQRFGNEIFKCWAGYLIAPGLIGKNQCLGKVDKNNTEFARSHLKIPVPQPRYSHLKHWFISDFIQGKMLAECWDSLSLFKQFRIACTLRGYVNQMRRLPPRSMPGSVEGGHIIGSLFESSNCYSGPFESALRFDQFIRHGAYYGWRLATFNSCFESDGITRRPSTPFPPEPRVPQDNDPLVFTHTDISLTNLILTDNGVLWLIDWTDSGFYPLWMEALGMYRYDNAPQSWRRWFWFIVGPPPAQQSFWPHFMRSVLDFGGPEPRRLEADSI